MPSDEQMLRFLAVEAKGFKSAVTVWWNPLKSNEHWCQLFDRLAELGRRPQLFHQNGTDWFCHVRGQETEQVRDGIYGYMDTDRKRALVVAAYRAMGGPEE